MGCGSSTQSKNVVAPIQPMQETTAVKEANAANVHKPPAVSDAANRGAPAEPVKAKVIAEPQMVQELQKQEDKELESTPVVELGAGVSPTQQISEAVKQMNIPGAIGEKEHDKIVKTDDDRSKSTTPYTSNLNDLGETSPGKGNNVTAFDGDTSGELPKQAEPLPEPLDVDAIKLPAKAESVPYWERDPLPARPGTASRRPMSSGGKLTVYKTEKTKQVEAENKKKRLESGEVSAEGKPIKKASALPPLEERRKKKKEKKQQAEEEVVVSAPVKPARSWTGTEGGEAWSVETTDFKGPEPEVLTFD